MYIKLKEVEIKSIEKGRRGEGDWKLRRGDRKGSIDVGGLRTCPWSRIHERTISLRFLGIILRVLRLEVSIYNVYITNQSQTTFAEGGGG